MSRGELFEHTCCNLLNETYKNKNSRLNFVAHNTADSTESDIQLLVDEKPAFWIEVKENEAQSGQFVLFPNEAKRTFDYSEKNKTPRTDEVSAIILYMKSNFEEFKEPGGKGVNIDLPQILFSRWIINFYKNKHVKYIMSCSLPKNDWQGRKLTIGDELFIAPIDKFSSYFDVSARYRSKRSGSSVVPYNHIHDVEAFLQKEYNISKSDLKQMPKVSASGEIKNSDMRLYITNSGLKQIQEAVSAEKPIIRVGNLNYLFSENANAMGFHEIRKRSTTVNANVIFSIKAKSKQRPEDLENFKSALRSELAK